MQSWELLQQLHTMFQHQSHLINKMFPQIFYGECFPPVSVKKTELLRVHLDVWREWSVHELSREGLPSSHGCSSCTVQSMKLIITMLWTIKKICTTIDVQERGLLFMETNLLFFMSKCFARNLHERSSSVVFFPRSETCSKGFCGHKYVRNHVRYTMKIKMYELNY